MERQKIVHPNQCGFRQSKNSVAVLARLDTFIKTAFARKEHAIAVFFVLKKVYDTAGKNHILKVLSVVGLRGNTPKFIERVLAERVMRVLNMPAY